MVIKNKFLSLLFLYFFVPGYGQQIVLKPSESQIKINNGSDVVDLIHPIDLYVNSMHLKWIIICRLNLIDNNPKTISSDKVFVKHNYSSNIDGTVGEGYIPLDKPIVIAQGTVTGGLIHCNTIYVRILNDEFLEPGEYNINIEFSYEVQM